jgi:hypothetical protein
MKHIKNSIKGSIFLLEHAGVPVALSTDFTEPIKNGSLCVNTTNQDLYILKGNVWVMLGSGFNMDDWIPRGGTVINKPVYGDIEITDGIKFYSGQSGISFSDSQLLLEFSDNDLDTNENFALVLDRNFVLQKNSALVTFDSASKNNFINKIHTIDAPGVSFSNTTDNIIQTNLNYPASFNNVFNSILGGALYNTTDFSNIDTSTFYLNSTPQTTFANILNSHVLLNIEQTLPFNSFNSSYLYLRGRVHGQNNKFNDLSNSYLDGTFKNSNNDNNEFLHFYGNNYNSEIIDSHYIYNLGHITGHDGAVLTGSSSTTSIIQLSYGVYNLGVLGAVKLSQLNNSLFLGKNTNIKGDLVYDNTLLNNNGYYLNTNSSKNVMFNNENKTFTSTQNYSKLENSNSNLLFNNNEIHSTSSNYNLVINTDNIKLYGSNSLVFTPKEVFSGFTGRIYGGNNVIFSLKPNKNYSIHSNVFTFGDINSTSGVHINNGNVIMGNVDIDSSLTTNNQIFGAKRLQNINHSGQFNNIFLNVDNFNVPDSNTVYLPNKIYGINLGNFGLIDFQSISANRNWDFPDKSGTIALLDDIASIGSATAGNGLFIANDNKTIKLGGNLTEYTTVYGNGNILNFNSLDAWYATTDSGVIQFVASYSNTQNALEIQDGYAFLKSRNMTTNSQTVLQNQTNLGYWQYYNGSSATTRIQVSESGLQLKTNSYFANFKSTNLTNDKNYELPNKSGTVALIDDVTGISLNDISDVNISSPQNLDVLSYDSASTSWMNNRFVKTLNGTLPDVNGDVTIGGFAANTCYVVGFGGDDITAEIGNILRPFETIGAAIEVAKNISGSLIEVLPGTYSLDDTNCPHGLMKPNSNYSYYFHPNSFVVYDGSYGLYISDTNSDGDIFGFGNFTINNSTFYGSVFDFNSGNISNYAMIIPVPFTRSRRFDFNKIVFESSSNTANGIFVGASGGTGVSFNIGERLLARGGVTVTLGLGSRSTFNGPGSIQSTSITEKSLIINGVHSATFNNMTIFGYGAAFGRNSSIMTEISYDSSYTNDIKFNQVEAMFIGSALNYKLINLTNAVYNDNTLFFRCLLKNRINTTQTLNGNSICCDTNTNIKIIDSYANENLGGTGTITNTITSGNGFMYEPNL